MAERERHVPKELRARKQWVGALITAREGGKAEKQPINPHTGGLAKVNDAGTWGTFEQAEAWRKRQAAREGVRHGIGFVFTADDPYVGIDLDHCYDERGELQPWAEAIVQRCQSYSELSVSRTGLHIILRGALPEGGRRKGQIEMYDRSRFFVFTGEFLFQQPMEVEERGEVLRALHGEVFNGLNHGLNGLSDVTDAAVKSERRLNHGLNGLSDATDAAVKSERRLNHGLNGLSDATDAAVKSVSSVKSVIQTGVGRSDDVLLAKAAAARNGEKFTRLWGGQWQGLYPSQSEADLALCGMLAFWAGGDAGRIDRLFRESGLMRPKWDERHFGDGRTYGEERVMVAVAGMREVYGDNKVVRFKEGALPEDRGYEGDAADFWPVEAVAEEPAWMADNPLEQGMRCVVEEVEVAQALACRNSGTAQAEEVAQALACRNSSAAQAKACATTQAEACATTPCATTTGCPPLPEGALVDPAVGRGAAPWLDAYIAHSRAWAPVAFDDFHEGMGIFLLSATAGRRIVAHLNGPHYPNLYVAFVARSSLWRKSTTVKIGREVLEAAGLRYLLAPSDCTPEAYIKKCAEKGPSDWAGLSGERLREAELKAAFAAHKGWIHNEFGGKMDKIAHDTGPMAGFSPLLRELDDCPSLYDYSTTGRGDAVMEQPFLSLMACMTPADLDKHASRKSSLWGDGFWARFAMISPASHLQPLTAESREGERIPPAELVRALRQWHERLGIPEVAREERERSDKSKYWEVTVNRPPAKAYGLGEGVKAAHDRYAHALERLAFEQNLEAMDGGYTRLAEKALRVSLLLASISGSERIELRHWARAQAITERWRAGLHAMFEAVNGGGPVTVVEQARVQAEERVLRELRKKGGEGASAGVMRALTGFSVEMCVDTLKRLAEVGLIKVVRTNREKHPVFALAE